MSDWAKLKDKPITYYYKQMINDTFWGCTRMRKGDSKQQIKCHNMLMVNYYPSFYYYDDEGRHSENTIKSALTKGNPTRLFYYSGF